MSMLTKEKYLRAFAVTLTASLAFANPAFATTSLTAQTRTPPPIIGDLKAPDRTRAILTETCQWTNAGHAKCIVYDGGDKLGEYCVDHYGNVFKCP